MADHVMRAREILSVALDVDVANIREDASMQTLEAWDSLAHMRIILALEAAIGHEITPDLLVDIEDLDDIAEVLQNG